MKIDGVENFRAFVLKQSDSGRSNVSNAGRVEIGMVRDDVASVLRCVCAEVEPLYSDGEWEWRLVKEY